MRGISFLLFLWSCASPLEAKKNPVEQVRRQLYQCYEESDSFRKKEAEDRGMIVEYSVYGDGKVRDPKILNSDFKDANLHACVLGFIRELTYPTDNGRGEMVVQLPVNFILVEE